MAEEKKTTAKKAAPKAAAPAVKAEAAPKAEPAVFAPKAEPEVELISVSAPEKKDEKKSFFGRFFGKK